MDLPLAAAPARRGGSPAAASAPLTPVLRVLVVCPYGGLGGSERWLLQLLDATPRLRVEAVLLADGPLRAALETRGVPVTLLTTGPSGPAVARSVLRLAAHLRRAAPDVVLANGVKAAAVAAPAAWWTGHLVVWAKHDHSFDARLGRLLATLVREVVGPSVEVARAGTGRDGVVLTPPHPGPALPRSAARAELASRGVVLPETAPVAACVGRLVPYKGVEDAVAALAEPGSEPWHLLVVGGDDHAAPGEGARLAALAERLGVAERVHLAGELPAAARLLSAVDAVLLLTKPSAAGGPSREGFGMVALEAAVAGVPVVATDGPAVAALGAREPSSVAVVPPGAPSAVAAALARWQAPAARRAAGAAAARAAADHPAAPEVADALAAVLAAVAARAGAGMPADRGVPVSVVAPLYREGAHVDALVTRLRPLLREDDELVLVDDGSPDDTGDRVRRAAAADARLRAVARPRNGGVGAARNSGVEVARHEVVAFADAGCRWDAGWLDALRAAASEDVRPGLVVGAYRVGRDDAVQRAVAVACYPDAREARRAGPFTRAWLAVLGRRFDATTPAGRSFATTRSAWAAVGGFDERRRAAEDVDYARAVARAGFPCVLATDADLEWEQAADLTGTARMYLHYGRGDAQAESRRPLLRDLVRAAAYPLALATLAPGPAARTRRAAVVLGGLAYAAVPLRRAAGEDDPLRVAALVPAALAVKDLAKAAGALDGLRHAVRS